jgi:hypothetical protein
MRSQNQNKKQNTRITQAQFDADDAAVGGEDGGHACEPVAAANCRHQHLGRTVVRAGECHNQRVAQKL